MKASSVLFGLIIATAFLLAGSTPSSSKSDTVAEGVIFYVQYHHSAGEGRSLTRFSGRIPMSIPIPRTTPSVIEPQAVDAHGRLTPEFLIITWPQSPDLGPLVIPVHRLVSVQFGDGGIKQINQNQPQPAK